MSQSSKLYRLQKIDRQLDRAETRLREIVTALSENAQLVQAQMRYNTAEEKLQLERKGLRRAEDNVTQQQTKIKRTEHKLYSGTIQNPKELQDLQNEAASLKRYLGVLEDRQLDAMLAVESAESVVNETSAKLDQIQAQIDKEHFQLREEQSGLHQDMERLEVERKAAENAISKEELVLYTQLRLQKSGFAVTKISDNTCASCGSTLTAALIQSAHSPNQLVRCSSCGRIIYPG